MKSFPNRKFKIEQADASYADLIRACAKHVGQTGVDIDEQRKRFRILDVLDKTPEIIELEDADAEHLKGLVKKMQWALVSKDVVAFGDAVEKL
jgi:hypothetical protein